MMSNVSVPPKQSSLEIRINQEIKKVVAYLVCVCLIGAVGCYAWNANNIGEGHVGAVWYLGDQAVEESNWDFAESSLVQFFYYFLLMANFVPVSLYTSMSTVKFFQSRFIESDINIYHEETDTPTAVRTMALNEELGQISHVFSDKTGTLTCNIMDFRKCSVNGISYGRGVTEIGKAAAVLSGEVLSDEELEGELLAQEHSRMHQQPHVNFYDQSIRFDLVGAKGDEQAAALADFFTVLALCHSVIPEHVEETGEIKLSASSPDDEALVCGAKFFGFEFVDRTQGLAVIRLSNGELKKYQIIEMIEFNSTRKRMSVVVEVEGTLQLFCKGADTVMVDRLAWTEENVLKTTSEHMTAYAKEGLRTLMICRKTLDPDWFETWHADFRAANADLNQIEKKMTGQENDIDKLSDRLERDLKLVGASAIEDKLQDGVPECIADLAKAGIKIWVLTGDKVETAINIAVACRLLQPEEYMEQIVIDGDTYKKKVKLRDKLIEAIKEYDDDVKEAGGNPNMVKPRALIIDGPALIIAVDPEIQQYLLRFTQCCKAVVGCRVSPDQKRQMVAMVKDGIHGVKTLAIGDGANDVAMIQAAHVGIGISGQEGMQAVNASDYAIAQFKYLRRLLLLHGRWNYRRMSRLVCYTFYKNIVMAIVQFWYAFQTGFSGQKFYFEGGIQLFNIAYTGFPIMFLGIFDKDVNEDMLLKYPQLYNNGIRDAFFNTPVFMSWILAGTFESLVISILPLYMLQNTSKPDEYGGDGCFESLWMYGATCFSIMVLVVNLKLMLNTYQFPWFSLLAIVLSVAVWFLTAWGFSSVPHIDGHAANVFQELAENYNFWLTLLVVTFGLLARDFFFKGWQRAFKPQLHHVLQELVELGREDETIHVPVPPPPRMFMKEKILDFPEAGDEGDEDIEMLRQARRGTKTISDYFHSPALGFAYTPSDLQTVMEERNIVLGKKGHADDVKSARPWRVMEMFGGGGGGEKKGMHHKAMAHKASFSEGIDFFDEDDDEDEEEIDAELEAAAATAAKMTSAAKRASSGGDNSEDGGRWSVGF
jgi:phospholipid-translocating P-type ATPase (flippase)